MSDAQMIVPIKSIRVLPGRGRKEFNRVFELAESIKARGLICPICVTNDTEPGKYILTAGERRYRASIMALLTEVPIVFKEKLSALDAKIIELEENTCRENLTWQEEGELHRQIDELKREQNPGWTQQQTADMVGVTRGHVASQIILAKKLNASPELKEKVKDVPMNVARKIIEAHEEVQRVDRLQAQGKLKFTTDLKLGDCTELIKELPDKSVDMLLTDPPYGLEQLEAIREGNGGAMPGHTLMSDTHNMTIDQVLFRLRKLAPELQRVLKPGAHCYVFSAFQYVGDFINALAPLEFQPPLLIWDRQRSTSPGYGYNYLNRTEAIIYFHNPPRTRRLAKSMFNILEFPTVPDSLRVYPTEKPIALLKTLIAQSSITNDMVLDLFAGSGSTLKAAKALGRRSIGFEINEDSFKRAQLHIDASAKEPTT